MYLGFLFMGKWSHLCSIPFWNTAMLKQQEKWASSPEGMLFVVRCSQSVPRDQVGNSSSPQWQTKELKGDLCRGHLACWLTRQCEGPWWMRMRTMSTSPRQAARCSGKHPLLSSTFVDASYCSSFNTTSLRQTRTEMYRYFQDQTCKVLWKHITRLYGSEEGHLVRDQYVSQSRGDGQLGVPLETLANWKVTTSSVFPL